MQVAYDVARVGPRNKSEKSKFQNKESEGSNKQWQQRNIDFGPFQFPALTCYGKSKSERRTLAYTCARELVKQE